MGSELGGYRYPQLLIEKKIREINAFRTILSGKR